ncbi:hypothetical protein BSLA_02r1885 [Burkholderia stabilis]|nr:hypothetical protein BSLA_02r1885 [Burkholderia stabilis]
MDRAERVRQGAECRDPQAFGDARGRQDVLDVVQPVECADDAKTVGHGPLDPKLQDIVRQRIERHQVFASNEKAKRRLLDLATHQAHSLPGVFLEIAHADVELNRGDEVDLSEAGLIHGFRDRKHVRGLHARCPKALMSITKCGVDDADFLALHVHSSLRVSPLTT